MTQTRMATIATVSIVLMATSAALARPTQQRIDALPSLIDTRARSLLAGDDYGCTRYTGTVTSDFSAFHLREIAVRAVTKRGRRRLRKLVQQLDATHVVWVSTIARRKSDDAMNRVRRNINRLARDTGVKTRLSVTRESDQVTDIRRSGRPRILMSFYEGQPTLQAFAQRMRTRYGHDRVTVHAAKPDELLPASRRYGAPPHAESDPTARPPSGPRPPGVVVRYARAAASERGAGREPPRSSRPARTVARKPSASRTAARCRRARDDCHAHAGAWTPPNTSKPRVAEGRQYNWREHVRTLKSELSSDR